MKFIDFFAGIGGFRRGMELAGHKCVGFCEFDEYAVMSYTIMHLATKEQQESIKSITATLKKNGEPNLKNRQKEIKKEEYRNGEWYANDVRAVDARSVPRADCWCFGFPCQDISIAGNQIGFAGHRSSLFFAVTKIIRELEEQDRPKYLFIENVKNLLSVNGGFDFAKLLIEMDEIGYDAEWSVFNSKHFGVPQNRERVFIIGHLRGRGGRKVFPVTGTDGKDSVSIIGHRNGFRRNMQTFSQNGITETLDTAAGGGRGFNVGIPMFCDMNYGAGLKITENARCLQARYNKGISNHGGEVSGVCVPMNGIECINIADENGKERKQQDRVYDPNGIMTALSSQLGGRHNISLPILTPDRREKRQNGRRFKEDGEPMFTLTSQDRHGVGIGFEAISEIYTGVSKRFQRGPNFKEFRCIKENKFDSGVVLKIKEATKKGYAEAREGDTVNLHLPNSKTRRGRVGKGVANKLDTSCNQGIVVRVSDKLTVYAIWYEKYQCYIAIRRLTPLECFRLQGWTDEYFSQAAAVNSNSQLYKQAGNGVTVNVIQAIAERLS